MSNTETTNGTPKEGVFHHKTETVTSDHEKMITALAPLVEKLAPLVHAWRDTETEKAKLAETGSVHRQYITSGALILIVAAVCWLAYSSIQAGQATIAEKIVIGLLAFLGGIGARR